MSSKLRWWHWVIVAIFFAAWLPLMLWLDAVLVKWMVGL